MRNALNQTDPKGESSGPFVERFHPERLLDALNGKRDFSRELIRRPALGEDFREAGEVFVTELRKLIDAWLDSGRRADGVETPRNRKVIVTPGWGMAGYMGERTVFDAVQLWLKDNPPLPSLTDSGEVQTSLRQWLKGWTGPVSAALDEARILFLLLMTSKAKYALFKCSHPGCGVYYFLEKPRLEYKLGAVCPEHRRQQGTRRQRKQDHAEALQVAAEALAMWPKLSGSTHSKHKSEKDYVASKLKKFGVGSKWVTRNLTAIRESAR